MLTKLLILLPLLTVCTSFKIHGRITGGEDAIPYEVPYMVSVQVEYRKGKFAHSCGGAIINKNWIVTAAHCIDDSNFILSQRIAAGRYNITKDSEPSAQSRTLHYSKIHAAYAGTGPFDIALIYVKEPFIWTNEVQHVSLPKPLSSHDGIAFLYGWGLISKTFENIRPDLLQTASLPIIANKECSEAFPTHKIDSSNICTGTVNEVDACSSDSGGPLVQRGHLQRDTLVGIVSWGMFPCGVSGLPGVFVRVSHFIDWMDDVMRTYENSLKS